MASLSQAWINLWCDSPFDDVFLMNSRQNAYRFSLNKYIIYKCRFNKCMMYKGYNYDSVLITTTYSLSCMGGGLWRGGAISLTCGKYPPTHHFSKREGLEP